MSDRREDILNEEYNKWVDGKGIKPIYPPNFPVAYKDVAINAMGENGKQMCLDLLEFMAKNGVDCRKGLTKSVFTFNGKVILKEELLENLLK